MGKNSPQYDEKTDEVFDLAGEHKILRTEGDFVRLGMACLDQAGLSATAQAEIFVVIAKYNHSLADEINT